MEFLFVYSELIKTKECGEGMAEYKVVREVCFNLDFGKKASFESHF